MRTRAVAAAAASYWETACDEVLSYLIDALAVGLAYSVKLAVKFANPTDVLHRPV